MSESSTQKQQITSPNKEFTPLYIWMGENSAVLVKLAVFTAALFALPIVTFFLTLHSLFEGNTTYAAGAAAVMANVIVILYVITAMLEKPKDEDSQKEKKTE
ncbi:MAG: vacuolar ATPase assembly integral membrane protein vma21 [Benjaminiella poitrasii]|nr:MAG: vacuolar ATPase assembly integral membrane protein vma21 [Benjaminiella poitrasii]